mmetsp:Transcript_33929/g.87119  ORF Transcript_33929/g.87119 Transcript_33929/m.87119 type:complete len:107 (-) Transcript_33929:400-720(-)
MVRGGAKCDQLCAFAKKVICSRTIRYEKTRNLVLSPHRRSLHDKVERRMRDTPPTPSLHHPPPCFFFLPSFTFLHIYLIYFFPSFFLIKMISDNKVEKPDESGWWI